MQMKRKTYNLEMSQQEINNLESCFFTLMSNHKGKLGSDGIELFKKENPEIHKLYEEIERNRSLDDS